MRDALVDVAERLAAAGCDSPRVDAEFLVADVLGTSRSAIYADGARTLNDEEQRALAALVERRARREPLAYVLGEWGFRGLSLRVDPRVLVPRPETEAVVERCLALIDGIEEPLVLDVGTGSGAIALAIADEYAGARVTGLDSSEEALALARENVQRTGIDVELIRGDLFDGLPEGPWDLVVSNPPYVRPEEVERLAPEVRDWEPRAALVGTGATEAVARSAREVLRAGGTLVLETADGDAGRVLALLCGIGYAEVRMSRDLTGRSRVVEGLWL